MWVCSNCETANNSRKIRCSVCDLEKPFTNENPNSPSILKSKIQELEEELSIANEEKLSLIKSKEILSLELSKTKQGINRLSKEKDNVNNHLSIAVSEKKQLENKVTDLNKTIEGLQKNDKTTLLGIFMIALAISIIFNIININSNSNLNLEGQIATLKSENEILLIDKKNLETKLNSIGTKVPFVVTSIDFENTAEKNIYKRKFNYYKVKYIAPRLKIISIANNWSGKIYFKMFEPNGILSRNPDVSPKGFTFFDQTIIFPNQEYIYLSGWGSDSGSSYPVGTYSVEIWCNDIIIGKQTFEVSFQN